MSKERSSSAVRDLRTIFENKESEASAEQQQQQQRLSLSRETSRDGARPLSKVRSSFVVVEQAAKMADTTEASVENVAEAAQDSTASLRRQSFSENGDDHSQLAALKRVVSQESERRERDSSVAEAIPESVIEATPAGTPAVEAEKQLTLENKPAPASKLSQSATAAEPSTANPDKPVTSVDEDDVELQPADPTLTAAVEAASEPGAEEEEELAAEGKDIIEPQVEQPEPAEATEPSVEAEPSIAASSTPAASRPAKSAALGSPAARSSTQPIRDLNRKVSRSSLAAPTAASVARSADKRESNPPKSSPTKSRRESTRPVNVSSHLLAPTAASRARQGQEASKSSTTKSRPSLASRPESQSSQGAAKKTSSDSSFLDRLTRPTAASQQRAQEKYEPKRKALPVHRKPVTLRANGGSKPSTSTSSAAAPTEDESVLEESELNAESPAQG